MTDAPRPRLAWIPRDVLLVVIGALLALGVDEFRDNRRRHSDAQTALRSVRAELENNIALVTRARERHLFLQDTMAKLAAKRLKPSEELYLYGIVVPAMVSNSAWQLARETGALRKV